MCKLKTIKYKKNDSNTIGYQTKKDDVVDDTLDGEDTDVGEHDEVEINGNFL
jgi:hypothetical protein